VVSLEELLGQRTAHSLTSLDRGSAEVGLAHLPSRGSLIHIQLSHYRKTQHNGSESKSNNINAVAVLLLVVMPQTNL